MPKAVDVKGDKLSGTTIQAYVIGLCSSVTRMDEFNKKFMLRTVISRYICQTRK